MERLRIGVAGLRRGRALLAVFSHRPDCEVRAICDLDRGLAEKVAEEFGVPEVYTDFDEFLGAEFDVAVVATPAPLHAEQSVKALEAGRHVLCEVPAAMSLEECESVVRAVERTGRKYMMAENCCYFPFVGVWRRRLDAGAIGKPIYAEAEYVHDCRFLMRNPKTGEPTWRAKMPPILYPTHSLGPLLWLMEDRCREAIGLHTGCNSAPDLGAIDMEVGLFRTEKGAVIKVLCGFSVAKEPGLLYWSLQGTKGFLETKRAPRPSCETFLYSEELPEASGLVEIPVSLEHPKAPPEARLGGHGTAEWFMVEDFVKAVVEDSSPPIDVYTAMDYTVPGICAHLSAERGGELVEVPNFRPEKG